VVWNSLHFATIKMHLSFQSLIVFNTPSLQILLMDIHHNTSFRFILEDDSISLAFRAHIRFCLGKGAGLWLITRPSIHSFYITHFTFILTLCFCLSLIQPSTYNLWMWTWVRRIWQAFNMLSVWRLTNNHTWCHHICHVCFQSRKWAHYMEKIVVRPCVRHFITSQFIHD
jgi:hypothetical protein